MEDVKRAVQNGMYGHAVGLISILPTDKTHNVSGNFWINMFNRLQDQQPCSEGLVKFIYNLFSVYSNIMNVNKNGGGILFDIVRQPSATRVNYAITLAAGEGVTVNCRCRMNLTPALTAAKHGNYAALEILAKHGADLTLTDTQGRNVLHMCACGFEHQSINLLQDAAIVRSLVSLMIKASVDINAKTNTGLTPLMMICSQPPLYTLLHALLVQGADVNLRCDVKGQTVLHLMLATSQQSLTVDPSVLQELLVAGSDTEIADNGGRTALVEAVATNRLNAVCLLVWAHCNVNITYPQLLGLNFRDSYRRSILLDALLQGNTKLTRTLLDAGFSQSTLYCICQRLREVELWYGQVAGRAADMLGDMERSLRPYEAVFVRIKETTLQALYRVASNPHTLQHSCRLALRTHLRNISRSPIQTPHLIRALPLPEKLRDFVALEQLKDYF